MSNKKKDRSPLITYSNLGSVLVYVVYPLPQPEPLP
jgi:hypothetical protein